MDRRKFLHQSLLAAGAAALPSGMLLAADAPVTKLVILHTNDVHSRLDPFPMDGSRNQGLGGVVPRAAFIQAIRAAEPHVLLLDAGDIFQGTPYFNMYKGEPEIKAMSMMQYDACTMGNHDFDAGLENFAMQLQHASFPVLVANYDFTRTPMEHKAKPYKVFHKGPLKVGVFGIGIEMKGLVPDGLYGNTQYLDPIAKANETAALLKKKEKCDLIICLSHLGFDYKEEKKVSDKTLAAESYDIDLIIGGHTHTFLNEPVAVRNRNNHEVLINQVGFGGINLGRLDYYFSGVRKKKIVDSRVIPVEKKTLF